MGKKITLLAFVIFLIFGSAGNVFAAEDGGANSIKSVRHTSKGGIQTVTINVEKFGKVEVLSLTDPDRCVVNIGDVIAPIKQQTLKVKVGYIENIRYAQFESGIARVVLDLNQKSLVTVKTGKGYIKIEVRSGSRDSDTVISVPSYGNNASEATTIIEKKPTSTTMPQTTRTPRPKKTPEAGSTATPKPTTSPKPTVTPKPTSEVTTTSKPASTPENIPAAPPQIAVTNDRYTMVVQTGFLIVYNCRDDADIVEITSGAKSTAIVTKSKDGKSLTIDVPFQLQKSGQGSLEVNTDVLRRMKYTQLNKDTVRIILELGEHVKPELTQSKGKVAISLTNELLENINYHNDNGRVFLTLFKTVLTQGGEQLVENYKASYKSKNNVCTLTFDNQYGALKTGKVTIDDDTIKTIEVVKKSGKTEIIITAKAEIFCSVFSKNIQNVYMNETTVSVLKLPKKNEKLVVIDAGHGGHDPGALGTNGKLEKDYCLDIAFKLKTNLEKLGISTFLTRDADYFVDLYERAKLANDLKAALFVSVHANAVENKPDVSGTETLYFPSKPDVVKPDKLDGKLLAEIVQKNLIKELKTVDRSIKERPNLVVLRKTNMPSIIAETAFMTNEKDVAGLNKSTFRRSAAKALTNAVEEALKMIG